MSIKNFFPAAGEVATLAGEGFADPQAFAAVKGNLPIEIFGRICKSAVLERSGPVTAHFSSNPDAPTVTLG